MENVISYIEQNNHLLENYQLLVKTLKITSLDKRAILINSMVPKPTGYFQNVTDSAIEYIQHI